jgi:hypothetical protein
MTTRVIRVDSQVRAELARLARPGESGNAVVRRLLDLAPNQRRRGTFADDWFKKDEDEEVR